MVEWSAIQRNLHMRYILCIQHFSFNNALLLTSVYLFGKRQYTGAAAWSHVLALQNLTHWLLKVLVSVKGSLILEDATV